MAENTAAGRLRSEPGCATVRKWADFTINPGFHMKHITDAAPSRGSLPSNESNEPQAETGSDKADRVWQALAQMYGNTFVSSYGERPPDVWRWALERTSEEAIRRGLATCAQTDSDFAPSLPKFLEYCNPKPAGVRFLGTPETKKALEEPRASFEFAQSIIRKMRDRLNAK